ncbi:MAG: hypothetical protein ABMA64_40255 [Myxococcota bacterium]
MTWKLALKLVLAGAVAYGLGWFVVFTASFLLDVVPHGGAW